MIDDEFFEAAARVRKDLLDLASTMLSTLSGVLAMAEEGQRRGEAAHHVAGVAHVLESAWVADSLGEQWLTADDPTVVELRRVMAELRRFVTTSQDSTASEFDR